MDIGELTEATEAQRTKLGRYLTGERIVHRALELVALMKEFGIADIMNDVHIRSRDMMLLEPGTAATADDLYPDARCADMVCNLQIDADVLQYLAGIRRSLPDDGRDAIAEAAIFERRTIAGKGLYHASIEILGEHRRQATASGLSMAT